MVRRRDGATARLLRVADIGAPRHVLAVPSDASLTAAERFALDVLIDLSAVLRYEGAGDVVQLRVVDGAPAVERAGLRRPDAPLEGMPPADLRGVRRLYQWMDEKKK